MASSGWEVLDETRGMTEAHKIARRAAPQRKRPRLRRGAVVKLFALAGSIGALAFTLAIYDAASAIEDAQARIEASQATNRPDLASRYRALGIEQLQGAWSRPLQWHAGAQEAAGWAYALEAAQTGSTLDGILSYSWTRRALAHAPLHAQGWLRLASLHDVAPAPLCSVHGCLERSWASAPMGVLSRSFSCARIRLATTSGMVREANDLKVRLFMYELWNQRELNACLGGLTQSEIDAVRDRFARP